MEDHFDEMEPHLIDLHEEIKNFQDIAIHLKPLAGEIPKIDGIDIYGETIDLKGVVGGDHLVYVDFNNRYDLPERIREATTAGNHEIAERLERNKVLRVSILTKWRLTDHDRNHQSRYSASSR